MDSISQMLYHTAVFMLTRVSNSVTGVTGPQVNLTDEEAPSKWLEIYWFTESQQSSIHYTSFLDLAQFHYTSSKQFISQLHRNKGRQAIAIIVLISQSL